MNDHHSSLSIRAGNVAVVTGESGMVALGLSFPAEASEAAITHVGYWDLRTCSGKVEERAKWRLAKRDI